VRARLAAIGRELDREDLDVLCLQEVLFQSHARQLRARLSTFRYAAWQPLGPVVQGGLVTLSRHPIVSWGYEVYRVRGRALSPGLADLVLGKGFLVARLGGGLDGVAVVNTHLLANYSGDWSRENDYARRERAELAQLAVALRTLDPDQPVVVAGDFNVPAGAWAMEEFLAETGLADAFGDAPREPTWRDPSGRPGPVIDHVLVRPPRGRQVRLSASLCLRDPVPIGHGRLGHASDHLAVEADISID
jgi:endonuclease/exonuclease/phosphatase family metal-dependent hydrolase